MAFIDVHRHRWPVAVMCRELGLAERSYYAAKCRPPSLRALSDAVLLVEIRRIWEANYQVYGARGTRNPLVSQDPLTGSAHAKLHTGLEPPSSCALTDNPAIRSCSGLQEWVQAAWVMVLSERAGRREGGGRHAG